MSKMKHYRTINRDSMGIHLINVYSKKYYAQNDCKVRTYIYYCGYMQVLSAKY